MEKLLKNEPRTDYRLEISGVHYGANGDSVFGQKDTEEMGIMNHRDGSLDPHWQES